MIKTIVTDNGQHSTLTPEVSMHIRTLIMKGMEYAEIQQELDIPEGTWDSWYYRDVQGFRGNIIRWSAEALLKDAQKTIKKLMTGAKSERVQADLSKFMLETVAKDIYSKKMDLGLKPSEMSDEQLNARISNALSTLGYGSVGDFLGGIKQAESEKPGALHEGTRQAADTDDGDGTHPRIPGGEQNGQD